MRLEKLTDNFRDVLADAQSKAIANDNQFITPLHLMSAMLESQGTVYNVLQNSKIDIPKLKEILEDGMNSIFFAMQNKTKKDGTGPSRIA